jgi:hypothetical protein
MRSALTAVALLAGTGVAAAQEGGPIRTGEHASFSRIVMTIEPTTEWSLELGPREATVVFPGREITFGTEEVWQRIPRTRVTAIQPARREDGTAVRVALGCDCRVTASFVGARHLALDIHDGAPVAGAAVTPGAGARPDDATEADEGQRAGGSTAQGAAAPSLAEAERALRGQIARGAEQGVVALDEAPAETRQPEPRASEREPAGVGPAAVPRPVASPEQGSSGLSRPAARPIASEPAEPAAASEPAEPTPTAGDGWEALHAQVQIEAATVFDRDGTGRASDPAPHPACRPDEALDVARWSDGRPLPDQTVELRRLLVGEFDRPNGAVVRDLARLHIRFGLGAEAAEILRGFDAEVEERALLADLARVVESRAPDGPLSRDIACPGRHGLWLAVAGQPAMIASERHFRSMRTALEEMPPALRALVGPELVGRFLDAGRIEQARILHDVVVRPGAEADAAMRLASGRLAAAERRLPDAEAWLSGLVEANAPNAGDAVLALVRARLASGAGVPEDWITDLRVLALEQRRGEREPQARVLIAEAMARNGNLRPAFGELAALAADRPEAATSVEAVAARLLGEADPKAVGRAAYAEAAIGHAAMVSEAPANDTVRVAVGARLLDLGLPGPALAYVAPAEARGSEGARLVAARARLALGTTEAVLDSLVGVEGGEAALLRARAHALDGNFDAAAAEMEAAGKDDAALPYAWAGGDWARASASTDTVQAAMAAWMAGRADSTPTDRPSPLTPEAAFRLTPPSLDRPSLAVARTLLENGREVGSLLSAVLAETPEE